MARNRTRMRVTMACTECRKRKDRCDGERPSCRSCIRNGRHCSYNSSKKRGLRPGYVRTLEAMLALVFSTIEGSEAWLSFLLGGEEVVPEFSLVPPTVSTPASIESLLDILRRSNVLKQAEQLLSSSEAAEDQDEGETSSSFDRTALHAVELASKIIKSRQSTDTDGPPRIFPPSPMNTESTAQQTVLHDPIIVPPLTSVSDFAAQPFGTGLVLPDNWSHLLDIYFLHHHCWLPLSQKHDLLRCAHLLASHNAGSSAVPEVAQGDLAFLSAVLTYMGSREESNNGNQSQSGPLPFNTLSFLPDGDLDYDLGHVRALAIIALMRIQENNPWAAWTAVGRAVYSLSSLRSQHSRATLDEGVRRTILCCIVLDALIASWLGTRPYSRRSDIASTGLLSTEGIEEWESSVPEGVTESLSLPRYAPAHVLSTFNHVVEFAGILINLSCICDMDDNQLQHASRLVEECSGRLEAQRPDMASRPLAPQALNLHFLSTMVQEALKSKQIEMTGSYPGFGDVESSRHLRRTTEILQNHLSLTGSYPTIPLYNIYLHIIDRSLDRQHQLLGQLPSASQELQALRVYFADMGDPRGASRLQGPSSDAKIDDSQPMPLVAEDMAFDPLMDEDGLFQSLADLDSADWSANPPNFMRHLGVLSDLPPDLAMVLFDEDGS